MIVKAFMSATQIHTEIDFDLPRGKQSGHLAIPYSHNLRGWANLLIPICVIRNVDGPTVLLMAGQSWRRVPRTSSHPQAVAGTRARASDRTAHPDSVPQSTGGQSSDKIVTARRPQFQSLFSRQSQRKS
jgi:hypothetical protein